MALKLKRVQPGVPVSSPEKAVVPVVQRKSLIPTEKRKPSNSLAGYPILIYGEQGIGKSTLAQQFDDPLFLSFERGLEGLELYEAKMTEWQDFKAVLDDLKRENRFNTFVVDTVKKAYEMCMAFVCKRDNMKHPSDQGYGKGWNAVSTEFNDGITRLLNLGGVVFVSHCVLRTVESDFDGTWNRMEPDMPAQCMAALSGPVRIGGYYGLSGRKRFLWVEPDQTIWAKCSADDNFWSKDGERVRAIPMGESKEEAYKNLMLAFNNEQETSEGNTKVTLPVKRAEMKKK